MAGILAESVYRYATGSYKVQLLHQIKAPPSYDENGLDKQVGRILKEKPLLLSKTAFWWMNPFQFFFIANCIIVFHGGVYSYENFFKSTK